MSCVYPTAVDPGHGLFVRRRLEHMAALAEIRVVAPLPFVDYGNPNGRWLENHDVKRARTDGSLMVYHPKWFYPPLGGFTNAWWLSANLRSLLKRIRKEFPFDVIDAHHGHPDGVGAMLLARAFHCPFVVTLRGNEAKQASQGMLRKTLSQMVRSAGRVISVSENLRQLAIELGAPPDKARTIPNGVESDVFYERDRRQSRTDLKLPQDAQIILSAGSLSERKGHHRVAATLKTLRDNGLYAVLAVAGGPGREGDYEREIRAAAEAAGGPVVFLGHLEAPALAAAMSAADVFCLCSNREGWPNVVHEAMACGTPVIATRVGGLQQMVPDERLGRIVELGDPDALAGALDWALRRKWDRKAIAAYAHSRSWHQVACEVIDELGALRQETAGNAGRRHLP